MDAVPTLSLFLWDPPDRELVGCTERLPPDQLAALKKEITDRLEFALKAVTALEAKGWTCRLVGSSIEFALPKPMTEAQTRYAVWRAGLDPDRFLVMVD